MRITANLVQASPEKHLWAETYESEVGDILTVQREVAQSVAREIQVNLTPQEQSSGPSARQPKRTTKSPGPFSGKTHRERPDQESVLPSSHRRRSQRPSRLCWPGRLLCPPCVVGRHLLERPDSQGHPAAGTRRSNTRAAARRQLSRSAHGAGQRQTDL